MQDRSAQVLSPGGNKSIPSRSRRPSKDPAQRPQDRTDVVDRQTSREVVVDRRSQSVGEGFRGTIDPSVDGERGQARRQERERVVADDGTDLCVGKAMRCRRLRELGGFVRRCFRCGRLCFRRSRQKIEVDRCRDGEEEVHQEGCLEVHRGRVLKVARGIERWMERRTFGLERRVDQIVFATREKRLLTTALVPWAMACLYSSLGRINPQAVRISRAEMVDRLW